jgi:hypothetical protein
MDTDGGRLFCLADVSGVDGARARTLRGCVMPGSGIGVLVEGEAAVEEFPLTWLLPQWWPDDDGNLNAGGEGQRQRQRQRHGTLVSRIRSSGC